MSFNEIKLPSNKSFGLFFSSIFFILTCYFYINLSTITVFIFSFLTLFFFIISVTKPDLLYIFNKSWIFFGYILGRIFSPLILGSIFFLIISPISLLMKFFSRDELNLKSKNTNSFWICYNDDDPKSQFEKQF